MLYNGSKFKQKSSVTQKISNEKICLKIMLCFFSLWLTAVLKKTDSKIRKAPWL